MGHIAIRILCALLINSSLWMDQPAPKPNSKASQEPPSIISTEKFNQIHGKKPSQTNSSSSANVSTSPHSISFFGVRSPGERFIFVLDNSTSMLDGNRRGMAQSELIRAIKALKWPQQYYVIAFDSETMPLPFGPYVTSGADQTRKVSQWLSRLTPQDGTLPGNALRQAIGLKPDAVFLLTDGQFDSPTPAKIKEWNTGHVPIHVIDLGPEKPVEILEQIARDSSGVYRKRP